MERDGAGEHQLVVVLIVGERGQPEGFRAEQLGVGLDDAPRCLRQVLGGHVLAERHEEIGDGLLSGDDVDGARVGYHPQRRWLPAPDDVDQAGRHRYLPGRRCDPQGSVEMSQTGDSKPKPA